MPTDCSADRFAFAPVEGRAVVAAFDGGDISSDGGALLLRRPSDPASSASSPPASPTTAPRPHRARPGHPVAQRVYALALGYEDLNDHDDLRRDPLLATVVGKPTARRSDRASPGRQEHAQPPRTPPSGADALQEDRLPHPRRRTPLRDPLPPGPRPPARADRARPRRHRRPDPRPPDSAASSTATTGATATCRCTSSAAITSSAPGCGRGHRRLRRVGEAPAADRGAAPRGVARGQDHDPGRQRVLPRGAHPLVRGQRRRLRHRPGEEPAADRGDRGGARQESRALRGGADRQAGAGVRRAALSDAQDSWSRERRVVAKAEHLAARGAGANPRFVVTSLARGPGGTAAVRAGLLRPRRDGEPDQGAAAAPVRRPDQRQTMRPTRSGCSSRRSPTCCWRRCAGSGWRARGSPRPVPDDPAEAAEDRGVGAGDGAPDHGQDGLRPPLAAGLGDRRRRPRRSGALTRPRQRIVDITRGDASPAARRGCQLGR